jgi:hypothetical protein
MPRLSATLRREIIDWIVFGLSGQTLYGDARDVAPTDCDIFFVEQWHGSSEEAKLRRARLAAMSNKNLLVEASKYNEIEQRAAALLPRKRGRPRGAGSLAQDDEPLLAEIRTLMTGGLSRHAATLIVADRALGGGVKENKARRLGRRLWIKNTTEFKSKD